MQSNCALKETCSCKGSERSWSQFGGSPHSPQFLSLRLVTPPRKYVPSWCQNVIDGPIWLPGAIAEGSGRDLIHLRSIPLFFLGFINGVKSCKPLIAGAWNWVCESQERQRKVGWTEGRIKQMNVGRIHRPKRRERWGKEPPWLLMPLQSLVTPWGALGTPTLLSPARYNLLTNWLHLFKLDRVSFYCLYPQKPKSPNQHKSCLCRHSCDVAWI